MSLYLEMIGHWSNFNDFLEKQMDLVWDEVEDEKDLCLSSRFKSEIQFFKKEFNKNVSVGTIEEIYKLKLNSNNETELYNRFFVKEEFKSYFFCFEQEAVAILKSFFLSKKILL